MTESTSLTSKKKRVAKQLAWGLIFCCALSAFVFFLPALTHHHLPMVLPPILDVFEIIVWLVFTYLAAKYYFDYQDQASWGCVFLMLGLVCLAMDYLPLFDLSLQSLSVQWVLFSAALLGLGGYVLFQGKKSSTPWWKLLLLSFMLMLASACVVVAPLLEKSQWLQHWAHQGYWMTMLLYVAVIVVTGVVYQRLFLKGEVGKRDVMTSADYALVILPIHAVINGYMLISHTFGLNGLPQLMLVYDDLFIILGLLLMSKYGDCCQSEVTVGVKQNSGSCCAKQAASGCNSRRSVTHMPSPGDKHHLQYVLPAMLVLMPVTVFRYLIVDQPQMALSGSLAVFFLLCPCVFLSTDNVISGIKCAKRQQRLRYYRNLAVGSYAVVMAGLNMVRPMDQILCWLTPATCALLVSLIQMHKASVQSAPDAHTPLVKSCP